MKVPLSLDPSISSLSNDKSIKSSYRREIERESIMVGITWEYLSIYLHRLYGTFGSEISLTFMQKTHSWDKRKEGRNRQWPCAKEPFVSSPFLKVCKRLKLCGNFVLIVVFSRCQQSSFFGGTQLTVSLWGSSLPQLVFVCSKSILGIRCKERGAVPFLESCLLNPIQK